MGGVQIRVHAHTALFAVEYRLAFAVVPFAVPAFAARLGRVCRVDEYEQTVTRNFRLVFEFVGDATQCGRA